MIFGCQSSIIYTSKDIHIDIQARISLQVHSAMDIRKQQISMNGYPCFTDISLQLSILLWTSMHWPAMDSRSRDATLDRKLNSASAEGYRRVYEPQTSSQTKSSSNETRVPILITEHRAKFRLVLCFFLVTKKVWSWTNTLASKPLLLN